MTDWGRTHARPQRRFRKFRRGGALVGDSRCEPLVLRHG